MQSLFRLCFADRKGAPGYIEVALGGIPVRFRQWKTIPELLSSEIIEVGSPDCYFGPAIRNEPNKVGKTNCVGSAVCWIDIDSMELQLTALPPTALIWSGHGWHAYWKLAEFENDIGLIEDVNKALAATIEGDSAHNIDRMLRIPGSLNVKREPFTACKVVSMQAARIYSIAELKASAHIAPKVLHRIVTGDERGYKSRSERDWSIVQELVRVGLSDASVEAIFGHHLCGDKYRERLGPAYLTRTLQKVRTTRPPSNQSRAITELDKSYWIDTAKGKKQLSTFLFQPTLLLEGETDTIVGDISATSTDYVWENVMLPREAFGGVRSLSKHLTKASWVWLGTDGDVRALLAYLVSQLEVNGIPRAKAVASLGRHRIEGDTRDFFVASNYTLASDGSVWADLRDSPVVYVPPQREAPIMELVQSDSAQDVIQLIGPLVTRLNEPSRIWPILGWMMAAPFKPALNDLRYRFPILNVTGTRGSGKSTILLEVMQRLFACRPMSYSSGTTQFVILCLLGSTTSVPIAFSEFRSAITPEFLRYVLLSYDTGRDARGRADQTTVTYPLIAPFTLDGEDKVDDAAALERIIAVVLSPQTIEEGSDAWMAFEELQQFDLEAFALPYLRYTLQLDIAAMLESAEEDVHEAFAMSLPSRIRRNLVVCWFGIRCFRSFMQAVGAPYQDALTPIVLQESLENVYSTILGRAPIAADSFIELIVNAAAQGEDRFPWIVTQNILWFQLTPAIDYFKSQRARQHQTTLSRDAIRQQLAELVSDYMLEPKQQTIGTRQVMSYGVDLEKAVSAGIDVPSTFQSDSITIQY